MRDSSIYSRLSNFDFEKSSKNITSIISKHIEGNIDIDIRKVKYGRILGHRI